MKDLSILICTMPVRHKMLDTLMYSLDLQKGAEVEVLVNRENGCVGQKRNRLLDASTGRYIVYVDDDDRVSPDYCSLILQAMSGGVDCVGMQGVIVENGAETWRFRHSITVGNWCKDKSEKIYFRTPNHLNPVKREFALQTRFPPISYGEDRDYSNRIKPLLKTEFFIEKTIYYYNVYQRG